jgi:hypothetical protein
MAGEYRWHLMPELLKRRRKLLIIKLGGMCISCGSRHNLEFHHPNGKSWRSRQYGPMTRLKIYEREIEEGLIELLCDTCHNDPKSHPDHCFCPHCRDRVTTENF